MTAKCEDCGKFAAVTYPVWLGAPYYSIDRDVCRRCAESLGVVVVSLPPGDTTSPADTIEWLRANGWTRVATLGDIAQRWKRSDQCVTVPLLPSSPDFRLRWDEMLDRLRMAYAGAEPMDDEGLL